MWVVRNGVVYNVPPRFGGEDVKFKSPLTEWHYSNGGAGHGHDHLGANLNEDNMGIMQKSCDLRLCQYEYFKERFRNDGNTLALALRATLEF